VSHERSTVSHQDLSVHESLHHIRRHDATGCCEVSAGVHSADRESVMRYGLYTTLACAAILAGAMGTAGQKPTFLILCPLLFCGMLALMAIDKRLA